MHLGKIIDSVYRILEIYLSERPYVIPPELSSTVQVSIPFLQNKSTEVINQTSFALL